MSGIPPGMSAPTFSFSGASASPPKRNASLVQRLRRPDRLGGLIHEYQAGA